MHPAFLTRQRAWIMVAAAALGLWVLPALAQNATLTVLTGQSKTFRVDYAVDKVAIGDPAVIGVVRTSDREMLVNGQQPGSSNLIVMGRAGEKTEISVQVKSTDVEVQAQELQDMLAAVEGVKVQVVGQRIVVDGEVFTSDHFDKVKSLCEGLPSVVNQVNMSQTMKNILSEQIRKLVDRPGVSVRTVKNSFLLDGVVDSPEEAERAVRIAQAYSPHVVNALKVEAPPEPVKPYVRPDLVEVTFSIMEVTKDAMRLFGIYWNPGGTLDYNFDRSTRQNSSNSGDSWSANLATALAGTISNLFPKMRRIENMGKGRSLMQQTVLTKVGGEAKFFAGSEIPVPVAQQAGLMSVEYKKVGMTLNVSPVVDPEGNIDSALEIESSSVTGEGQDGAAIIGSNHLSTAVNVQNGDSIALGGLIGQRELRNLSYSPPPGSDNLSLIQLNKETDKRIDGSEVFVFVTVRLTGNVGGEETEAIGDKTSDSFKQQELETLRQLYRSKK